MKSNTRIAGPLSKEYTSIQYLVLIAITLLALALRLYKLGAWSFWIDELFTIRDAINHNAIPIEDLYRVKSTAGYGFNFISISYALVRLALDTWGLNEWSARLFPALIGAVSIPAFYFPIRKNFGAFVGLVSVLFIAISPWHIQLSQNARYYTAIILFSLPALFAFYFGVERNRFDFILLAFALIALATLERIYALFFLPVIVIYLVLLVLLPYGRKPAGLTPKNVAVFLSLPVLLYAAYEALYAFVLHRETFISVFLSSRFLGLLTAKPEWLLTGLLTDIGLPVAGLAAVGALVLFIQRRRLGLLLSVGAATPLLILMVLAPFFQTSTHYMVLSLPCIMILAAVGLKELYLKAARPWGLAALTGILMLFFVGFLRDRVVRDVEYFYLPHIRSYALVGVLVFLAACLVFTAVLFAYALLQKRRLTPDGAPARILERAHASLERLSPRLGLALWMLGLVPILILHPLVTDQMYYRYQHGYRDNDWRSAMAVVKTQRLPGDRVVSAMPPVASYYLDDQTEDLAQADVQAWVAQGQRVWVIYEYGAMQIKDQAFEDWMAASCQPRGAFDRYVRGRLWKMRVILCEP